jgi:hypothetical protein
MTLHHTRMAASALGVITTAGLAATIPFWANAEPARAANGYHDAVGGIAASREAPISARPSVYSTNGSAHRGSGGASSSDGTISSSPPLCPPAAGKPPPASQGSPPSTRWSAPPRCHGDVRQRQRVLVRLGHVGVPRQEGGRSPTTCTRRTATGRRP